MKFNQLWPILLGAVILNTADCLLKAAAGWKTKEFIIACMLWIISIYPAYKAFHSSNFGQAMWVWAALATLLSTLTAVMYYHEPLRLKDFVVVMLSLCAIVIEST